MDINEYKAMLERQAKERSDLEKNLESTRDGRARAAAWAEKVQPSPPRPTWAAKDSPTPSEADIARHKHNLAIKDRQELAALDQKHAAERAQHNKIPSETFNRHAKRHGTENPGKLQFPEDQQPKQQPPAAGSQTEQKKPGLQFPEEMNPNPDPNHPIKR